MFFPSAGNETLKDTCNVGFLVGPCIRVEQAIVKNGDSGTTVGGVILVKKPTLVLKVAFSLCSIAASVLMIKYPVRN